MAGPATGCMVYQRMQMRHSLGGLVAEAAPQQMKLIE